MRVVRIVYSPPRDRARVGDKILTSAFPDREDEMRLYPTSHWGAFSINDNGAPKREVCVKIGY